MTEVEIDAQVRTEFQKIKQKTKDVGMAINKAIDLYFELKEKSKQLELDFQGGAIEVR